jgi:GT2 family glycosyltransferase
MLSIIVLIHNTRASAANCLESLIETEAALGLAGTGAVEYILIDDHSDPQSGVVELMHQCRQSTRSDVWIIHLKSHRHYAYGVAIGLSVARGSNVLFVSHDMIVTPDCVRTLLETVATDDTIGVIRPVSRHMDGAANLRLEPPLPLRDGADVVSFSRVDAQLFGREVAEWSVFIGDAMLITRRCIDRIGVFDTRFYGFMADIDYGLRAQHAGFRVVIARGAWLHHEGAGFRKATAATAGAEAERAAGRRFMEESTAAWEVFRQKWDETLPRERGGNFPSERLRGIAQLRFNLYQPPLALDPEICQVL